MTMVVLQWEHKLHCAFFLGNSGEEAMLSQPKHVLVHGTQCPEVPEHPGSCSWQSENMYKVRRMPWVSENMAKLPRRSTIYQTSTANKQHLMDNVGHTTQMLHSYVSLRNQDCTRKLQSKFQEQHVAYSTPLETSEVTTPRAQHLLLLQKLISLNQAELAGHVLQPLWLWQRLNKNAPAT